MRHRVSQLLGSTLVRFAIASLVPTLALGAVLTVQATRAIEARTSRVYGDMTNVIFRMAADVVVSPEDLRPGTTYSPERAAIVNSLIARIGQSPDTVRVKIANRDRVVVFDNRDEVVGDVLEGDEQVRDALHGEVATRFTRGRLDPRGSDTSSSGTGSLIEIYLPITFAGDQTIHGLVVASGIDTKVVAGIERDVRRMQMSMTIGLAALWLCSLPIAHSVSRRLRRSARENAYLALHDPLTGLPNRNLFNDRLEQAIAACPRVGGQVGVVLLDLDRFKEVNDTLGHGRGDQLLRAVGERLTAVIRASDTVARLGGDEFAIVVTGLDDRTGLAEIAERIAASVRQVVLLDGVEVAVEASAGGSVYPAHADGAEELVRHADIAMYAAKANGEAFRLYTADIDSHSPSRLALAAELQRAFTCDDQLVLFYQPVAATETGDLSSVEALVRWNHPTRGLLPPIDFIPMAEQSGLITELTARVLDLAIEQARRWSDEGLDISISVNLSAADLRGTAVLEHVGGALERHGVAPDRLELEVTETALLENAEAAVALVASLHRLGVRIALDDFGTGYSSLSYLKRLMPDRLKIDRTFVNSMTVDSTDAKIIRSVIDLAHSLCIGITAEGVETQEQWDLLRELGCECVQGFFLARPLDAGTASHWIRERLSQSVS